MWPVVDRGGLAYQLPVVPLPTWFLFQPNPDFSCSYSAQVSVKYRHIACRYSLTIMTNFMCPPGCSAHLSVKQYLVVSMKVFLDVISI